MKGPDTLPELPGCYLFRDAAGTTIYVGKAKNLRKRVQSYFSRRDLGERIGRMVSLIADIDFIVTANEVEALVLENSLIKAHQPRFNINLRDAKSYAYILLTDEEFPRITIARKMEGRGTYFGPFTSAEERDQVLSVVKKVFRLRSCRTLRKKGCLRASLGTCSAPCRGKISPGEYSRLVRQASTVLKGQASDLVKALRDEMRECARACDFERAIVLRDRIAALEHLSQRQDVSRRRDVDEDVVNYVVHEGTVYMMVFSLSKGTVVDKKEFIFEEGDEVLEEFLVQYYSETAPPMEVILPHDPGEDMAEFLSLRRGSRVTVTVPKIGAKKRLLSLVRRNIEVAHLGEELRLVQLQEKLGLDVLPRVIECFDVSHLSGTEVVGSMVRFHDGRPDKKNYRRFRIKTVEGVDDPAAIGEIVERRYSRLLKEGGDLPDLVVVDGGIAQLRAAQARLRGLNVDVPLVALAKREENVYVAGSSYPLAIEKNDEASLLLQQIRDEAHRFAITYHRLLRSKRVIR
ncbi:MAG: excinuclease ABC subunit UvrC [Methanolinea sp.]|nr:excinuclease ABC subunit UvrC [Methanolinea sp.]